MKCECKIYIHISIQIIFILPTYLAKERICSSTNNPHSGSSDKEVAFLIGRTFRGILRSLRMMKDFGPLTMPLAAVASAGKREANDWLTANLSMEELFLKITKYILNHHS